MVANGPHDSKPKSTVEKVLSIFADVRGGEGLDVLSLGLNVFLLLFAYYLLKTVREALILSENGAEVKTYSAAGQALLLLAIVPAYGAFASRVNRIRLISWVTVIFILNLLLFYGVGIAGIHEGIVFFLWVGIFNVLIVAQFWAFANDLYSEQQGKRLFPVIALGSSLGAVVGAEAASVFMKPMGPYGLMLAAAGVLTLCVLLTRSVHNRAARHPAHTAAKNAEAPLAMTSAWELLSQDRYLILIAVLTVLLNIVNTSGEFLLGKFVVGEAVRQVGSNAAAQASFIGKFYGDFFTWVNGIGLLLQMFAVSRILRFIGVRGALFILPCIAFVGYSFLLFLPVLTVVRWAKILENSTDYSVQNTTRQTLFLITSREAKYKVKAAIDTLFMRTGDVLQAVVVLVGTAAGLSIPGFAIVSLALTIVWLGVALALSREHHRRTEGAPVVVPANAPLARSGNA
jgi:ATP:ADP antiporter, AAA family